jgi:hypothetical protein
MEIQKTKIDVMPSFIFVTVFRSLMILNVKVFEIISLFIDRLAKTPIS